MVTDVPVPEPEAGQIRVKVQACGICGGDAIPRNALFGTVLPRIPEGLSFEDAAPLMCGGITAFNALRHAHAGPGDTIAVQGVGGVGHLAIQFADKMGFRTVAINRGRDKEKLARQVGADEYIDEATRATPARPCRRSAVRPSSLRRSLAPISSRTWSRVCARTVS